MRKSEILSLKWNNIDFKNRIIILKKTKNNEQKIIPINDILYETLKKIPRYFKSDIVFANKEGLSYGDIKKGFLSALKRAKIKDFTFHDLRHTFASYLVMNGVDIRTVQELMGHKDIRMTMRYSHLSKAHLYDAVQKLGTNLAQKELVQISSLDKSL